MLTAYLICSLPATSKTMYRYKSFKQIRMNTTRSQFQIRRHCDKWVVKIIKTIYTYKVLFSLTCVIYDWCTTDKNGKYKFLFSQIIVPLGQYFALGSQTSSRIHSSFCLIMLLFVTYIQNVIFCLSYTTSTDFRRNALPRCKNYPSSGVPSVTQRYVTVSVTLRYREKARMDVKTSKQIKF